MAPITAASRLLSFELGIEEGGWDGTGEDEEKTDSGEIVFSANVVSKEDGLRVGEFDGKEPVVISVLDDIKSVVVPCNGGTGIVPMELWTV